MPIDPESFNEIVQIYQTEIDSLIDNMGKYVTLYFASTVENVRPKFHDSVRGRDIRQPSYKAGPTEPAPTTTEHTRTLKALIRIDPLDYETFNNIDQPKSIVRLKTFLSDVPDLQRCDYIVINVPERNIIEAKYRMLREPIPTGLKHNRYAVTFWERY